MSNQTIFGQIATLDLQNHSIFFTLKLVNEKIYRIYDNDLVLQSAKPFDQIQVTVKSTGSKFKLETFQLVELLSFHRPFHQLQINSCLKQILPPRSFSLIVSTIHLDRLEHALQTRKLSSLVSSFVDINQVEMTDKLVEFFQKLWDESDRFQYLQIRNHLQKYYSHLSDIDQSSWKKFDQAMKKLIKSGQLTVEQIISQLDNHPYQLINHGQIKANLTLFRVFDQIAGANPSPERNMAGLQAILNDCLKQSNDCYISQKTLEQKASLLFDSFPTVKLPLVNTYRIKSSQKKSLTDTPTKQSVITHETIHIPKYLDQAEQTIVQSLSNRIKQSTLQQESSSRQILLEIDPELSQEQLDLLQKCITQPVSIITGPPGVGKTRLISAIYRYFQSQQQDIILSAPTGLACKNMAKAMPHLTIPHLYTIAKLTNDQTVNHSLDREDSSEDKDLSQTESLLVNLVGKTSGLIIDEASMLDVSSFSRILQALMLASSSFRLILTGDPNQLPSIGFGQVLLDLIHSQRIPVHQLTQQYRQQTDSFILSNAYKVLHGQVDLTIGPDFRTGRTSSDNETVQLCLQLLEKINAKEHLDDLIILTPYSANQTLSSSKLNTRLKAYFNPTPPKKSWLQFSIGDRVLQIKNNHSKNLANGDLGYITNIIYRNESQMTGMEVEFPSTNLTIKYSNEMAQTQLTLAYSISIHKSQGNGYKYVIILIPQFYSAEFFNRNMLYTAITRAKTCVYLIGGSPDSAIHAVQRPRLTRLSQRLTQSLPPLSSS